jgi:hypothetical protein
VRHLIAVLILILIAGCANHRPVQYRQVYAGTNGPERIGAQYFLSESDVDRSWIMHALDPQSYQKIVAQVNFNSQIIVALTAGKVYSFSGNIKIVSVNQYLGVDDRPLNFVIKVGVLQDKCRVMGNSTPFILAIVDRPAGFQPYGGFDLSNFEDQCSVSLSH